MNYQENPSGLHGEAELRAEQWLREGIVFQVLSCAHGSRSRGRLKIRGPFLNLESVWME